MAKIGYLQPVKIRRKFNQTYPSDFKIKKVSVETFNAIKERLSPMTRYAWVSMGYPAAKIKDRYVEGIIYKPDKTFYYYEL